MEVFRSKVRQSCDYSRYGEGGYSLNEQRTQEALTEAKKLRDARWSAIAARAKVLRFEEKLSVRDISRRLGVSSSALAEMFRKQREKDQK
jgi:AraC-like DNA-binding protein